MPGERFGGPPGREFRARFAPAAAARRTDGAVGLGGGRAGWFTRRHMIRFPRRHLPSLLALAAQVLERHGGGGAPATLSRELLAGFFDVCARTGQDGVLVEVAQAFAPLDMADASGLREHAKLNGALTAMISDRARFAPGGPRNAMPAKLTDCLIAALTLELADVPARSVTLSDAVQRETAAALASVVDAELGAGQLRAVVAADGRSRVDQQYHSAFDRMAAQLDARSARIPAQPKVPLHVVQAVQLAVLAARTALLEKVANGAIDRAKAVLERGSPETAARIDQPVSHVLTPRDLAVRRVTELQIPAPDQVTRVLLTSLSETLELVWTAPTAVARPYGVSHTYAVGELIEHPTFGLGTVKVVTVKNVEVEFSDGPHTLVHARGK